MSNTICKMLQIWNLCLNHNNLSVNTENLDVILNVKTWHYLSKQSIGDVSLNAYIWKTRASALYELHFSLLIFPLDLLILMT